MLLTLLSVPDCPNAEVALDHVQVAWDGADLDLRTVLVQDEEQARRWGMTGSPTLLIDGLDPFGSDSAAASVSCRLYRQPDGSILGAPSVAQLRAVLRTGGREPDPPTRVALDVVGRGGRGRLAPVEGGLRAIQRVALRAMAKSGTQPSPADLDRAARPYGLFGARVLQELAEQDFLTLDEAGALSAIYPFSARPSRHRVAIDCGPRVWAMCAVDALGIAAMTGRGTTIESTDLVTAEPVLVRVDHQGQVDDPAGAAVFVGRRDGDRPAERVCCDAINFFGSRHSAARWSATHPDIPGQVLDLVAAARLGRDIFADLLRGG